MSQVTVGIPDPALCEINPDAGGGVTGDFLPIASQPGYSTELIDNPFDSGQPQIVAAVIADPIGSNFVLALKKDGAAFPFFVMPVDQSAGWYFGDGSDNPVDGSAGWSLDGDVLHLFPGTILESPVFDGGAEFPGGANFSGGTSFGPNTEFLNGAQFDAGSNVLFAGPAVFADAMLTELPTSDPAVAGQLWSNLGIVTVSAG